MEVKAEELVAPVELKSVYQQALKLVLTEPTAKSVRSHLSGMTSPTDKFFDWQPVVIDLGKIRSIAEPRKNTWSSIISILREYRLNAIAFVNAPESFAKMADDLHLGMLSELDLGHPKDRSLPKASVDPIPVVEQERPVSAMKIQSPVRSGVQIYAKNRDLVILESVSNGAEVISDRDVHVYGTLMGRAVAGAVGDETAQIFAKELKAELVSIGGVYKTFEEDDLKEFAGHAVKIQLIDENNSKRIQISKL